MGDPAKKKIKLEKDERSALLIECVRTHSELYDKSHANYKDNNKKSLIWKAIAQEAGYSDGETASKRWQNIRSEFGRKKPSGDGAAESSYVYADQLSFLLPYLEPRPSSSSSITSNVVSPIGRGKPAMSKELADELYAYQMNQAPKEDEVDVTSLDDEKEVKPQIYQQKKKTNVKKVDKVEETLLKMLENEKEDEEERFGKNVASQLRTFPNKKKHQVMMEINQVLLNNMPDD